MRRRLVGGCAGGTPSTASNAGSTHAASASGTASGMSFFVTSANPGQGANFGGFAAD